MKVSEKIIQLKQIALKYGLKLYRINEFQIALTISNNEANHKK